MVSFAIVSRFVRSPPTREVPTLPTLILGLLLGLALLALAAFVLWRDRRAAAARREIDQRLEETARGIDLRADHLQLHLDRLHRLQRVQHLGRLLDDGVAEELIAGQAASRLRAAVRDLHEEAGRVYR